MPFTSEDFTVLSSTYTVTDEAKAAELKILQNLTNAIERLVTRL